MFKKSFMLAVFMIFASGSLATAACTAEEAEAKAQDFSNAAVALAQSNPEKYAEVAQAMTSDLPALQENADDLDKLCEFYDTWIEKEVSRITSVCPKG